jgi:hypothetical protein
MANSQAQPIIVARFVLITNESNGRVTSRLKVPYSLRGIGTD